MILNALKTELLISQVVSATVNSKPKSVEGIRLDSTDIRWAKSVTHGWYLVTEKKPKALFGWDSFRDL